MKGTNGKKLKMLNCKFACISDPAANTMQTAVSCRDLGGTKVPVSTRFMANGTPINGHYTTDNGITSEYEET